MISEAERQGQTILKEKHARKLINNATSSTKFCDESQNVTI